MEKCFSAWFHWTDRNQYPGIGYPGIYVIAISKKDISGEEFSFRKEVVYVGMTNAVSGLKGRLVQFDNTVARKRLQHGGADRVLFKHQNYPLLAKTLYVALRHFPCSRSDETATAFRVMGKVANAEYQCMARCVEEFGMPEFNRKKVSLKFSLTHGGRG